MKLDCHKTSKQKTESIRAAFKRRKRIFVLLEPRSHTEHIVFHSQYLQARPQLERSMWSHTWKILSHRLSSSLIYQPQARRSHPSCPSTSINNQHFLKPRVARVAKEAVVNESADGSQKCLINCTYADKMTILHPQTVNRPLHKTPTSSKFSM